METNHAKAIENLLSKGEEVDAEALVATCLVRAVHEFSQLNVLLLAQKQKKLTDKKRGEIFSHLAGIVNLLMILYHATDTAIPDSDELQDGAEEFPLDYQNDGILCNMYCIAALTSITSVVFDSDVGTDPEAPTKEEALAMVDNSLFDIYAGVMVSCERYEIDFDEVVADATNLEEWS